MKKLIIAMVAVLSMGMSAEAKTVKTTFKVSGSCELCEQRIEKAAKKVSGVLSCQWNQSSQVCTLVYDNSKTSPSKVQRAIAAAGHDAGKVKASTAAYNKIPSCCRYRSSSSSTDCHNGRHSQCTTTSKSSSKSKSSKSSSSSHRHHGNC